MIFLIFRKGTLKNLKNGMQWNHIINISITSSDPEIASILKLAEGTNNVDRKQSLQYYFKAFELGCDNCLEVIVHLYAIGGFGLEPNIELAEKYSNLAIEKGIKIDKRTFQFYYLNVNKIHLDNSENELALNSLLEGIKKYESSLCMNAIGQMYQNGVGVPRNMEIAKEWMLKAAVGSVNPVPGNIPTKNGSPSSMNILGYILMNENSLKPLNSRDYSEAQLWLNRAADQGFVFAYYNLGILYQYHLIFKGEGDEYINSCLKKAESYFVLAFKKGYDLLGVKDVPSILYRLGNIYTGIDSLNSKHRVDHKKAVWCYTKVLLLSHISDDEKYKTKKFLETIDPSKYIRDLLELESKYEELECENKKLKLEIEEIKAFPGGPLYQEALADWEERKIDKTGIFSKEKDN